MTIEAKKESVRQVIISAVPSILDLKMGCEVDRGAGEGIHEYYIGQFGDTMSYVRSNGNITGTFLPFDVPIKTQDYKKHIKIIGRPIQLSDVLIAIGKTQGIVLTDFRIEYDGSFFKRRNDGMYIKVCTWNLSLDFDHQEESVWAFLWELLVNEK